MIIIINIINFMLYTRGANRNALMWGVINFFINNNIEKACSPCNSDEAEKLIKLINVYK